MRWREKSGDWVDSGRLGLQILPAAGRIPNQGRHGSGSAASTRPICPARRVAAGASGHSTQQGEPGPAKPVALISRPRSIMQHAASDKRAHLQLPQCTHQGPPPGHPLHPVPLPPCTTSGEPRVPFPWTRRVVELGFLSSGINFYFSFTLPVSLFLMSALCSRLQSSDSVLPANRWHQSPSTQHSVSARRISLPGRCCIPFSIRRFACAERCNAPPYSQAHDLPA